MFGKLPKNIISRNVKITNKKLLLYAKLNLAEGVNMKSSVVKHYGCKRARHCGSIAN